MTLQELLDRPIAFQRAFVSLGVGITGALMLSQAIYWSNRTDDAEGWFYKTMEEWESETGMTRYEQEGARKKLVKIGVLEEQKKGVPCRLFYRVNLEAIRANLSVENPQPSLRKNPKQARGKPTSKPEENPQAITETTTEITSEITTETLPGEGAAAPPQPGEGGESLSDIPRCEIPPDMPGPRDPSCKTFKVWANYAFAYRKRYSTWPVWNARVGGLLGQLVDRLGVNAAPKVAAYYLVISDAQYLRECHSLTTLLSKAESIHTQWITGRPITGTSARQMENTQSNLSAAEQAKDLLRQRSGRHA